MHGPTRPRPKEPVMNSCKLMTNWNSEWLNALKSWLKEAKKSESLPENY